MYLKGIWEKMENKKGISLGITTIVVLATALIVLVVVTSYFLGGFGEIGEGVKDITSGAKVDKEWGEEVQNATEIFSAPEEDVLNADLFL